MEGTEGSRVHVVLNVYRKVEHPPELRAEFELVHAEVDRVGHPSARAVDCARNADSHRFESRDRHLQRVGERTDDCRRRLQHRSRPETGRHPQLVQDRAGLVDDNSVRLRAADVHAHSHAIACASSQSSRASPTCREAPKVATSAY